MTTVLYGYIYGLPSAAEINAQRIETLPMDDDDPYLTPDLFSVPLQIHSYNDHLITFGTLYKNLGIAVQWPKWREKFEALLRTLSWDRVRVYLDVEEEGRYEYTWTGLRQDDDDETLPAGIGRLEALFRRPTERWTFAGGRVGDSEY
jgi:hypothetical protein